MTPSFHEKKLIFLLWFIRVFHGCKTLLRKWACISQINVKTCLWPISLLISSVIELELNSQNYGNIPCIFGYQYQYLHSFYSRAGANLAIPFFIGISRCKITNRLNVYSSGNLSTLMQSTHTFSTTQNKEPHNEVQKRVCDSVCAVVCIDPDRNQRNPGKLLFYLKAPGNSFATIQGKRHHFSHCDGNLNSKAQTSFPISKLNYNWPCKSWLWKTNNSPGE